MGSLPRSATATILQHESSLQGLAWAHPPILDCIIIWPDLCLAVKCLYRQKLCIDTLYNTFVRAYSCPIPCRNGNSLRGKLAFDKSLTDVRLVTRVCCFVFFVFRFFVSVALRVDRKQTLREFLCGEFSFIRKTFGRQNNFLSNVKNRIPCSSLLEIDFVGWMATVSLLKMLKNKTRET